MEREQNFYEILEIPFGANDEDIKDNYKKLSKKHHPDSYQNANDKKKAHERMIKVNAAKDTLLNSEKRKEYDEIIRPALKHEQELRNRGDSATDWFKMQRDLDELLKSLFRFQDDAIDTAQAAYFAQDHQKSRFAEPRDGTVKSDIYISRRQRKW